MLPTLFRRMTSPWDTPGSLVQHEFDRMCRRLNDAYEADNDLVGAYPVDIREDADRVYVEAEMPGFVKEDVEITLEQGVLTIRGQRKTKKTEGEKHLTERRFTRVSRSFTLPSTVDESRVDAKLVEGVLHLTIEKKPEVKPRKIEIG